MKKMLDQNLGQKNSVKTFWRKNLSSKKIWGQIKFLFKEKFGSEEFWVKNFFCSKKF